MKLTELVVRADTASDCTGVDTAKNNKICGLLMYIKETLLGRFHLRSPCHLQMGIIIISCDPTSLL